MRFSWASRAGQMENISQCLFPGLGELCPPPPPQCFSLQTSQPLRNSRMALEGLLLLGRPQSSEAVIFGKGVHLTPGKPKSSLPSSKSHHRSNSSKNYCLPVHTEISLYNHGSGCLQPDPQNGKPRGTACAWNLPPFLSCERYTLGLCKQTYLPVPMSVPSTKSSC